MNSECLIQAPTDLEKCPLPAVSNTGRRTRIMYTSRLSAVISIMSITEVNIHVL